MNLKELLDPIATKYNVAITYQENSAEITGFFENNERLITKKVNCKIDIEDELDKLGIIRLYPLLIQTVLLWR